jgi:hypothetical protein
MVSKRNRTITIVTVIAVCLLTAACSLGMDDVLGRTTSDPFQEIPRVRSFNGDLSIVISWSRDEAADEYILYRAKDTATEPQYSEIYRGPLTEYRDYQNFSLSEAEDIYLYRLGKRRGSKLFVDISSRNKAALGVVSNNRIDFNEPNDSIESATLLDVEKLTAKSWFYSSNATDNIKIFDEDWYCIDIQGGWEASVVLSDLDRPAREDHHFNIEVYGGKTEEIYSGENKSIPNNTNHAGRFYFRIVPNYEQFNSLYDPLNTGGGYGKFITYTIHIYARRPITS